MHEADSNKVLVVGAGIGGLSAAIHLATAGKKVILYEQNQQVGGKMGEIRQGGYRWDTGPSVITMRPVFEDLFKGAGRQLTDYLELLPVEPLTRYFFPDGTVLNASQDLERMLPQIQAIEPQDIGGYQNFLSYAAELYRIVSPVFIYDQPPRLSSLFKVSPMDALRVDGFRTMHQVISRHVRSPQLQQFLGRFATYVGASPYHAPATLNVIAHVELNQGVWYPQGGVYQLAQSFARLAQELGVEIHTGCQVRTIDTRDGQVKGIILANDNFVPASAVIANLDVAWVYDKLLPSSVTPINRKKRLLEANPSGSAFILMLGVAAENAQLTHHNIFFSTNYRLEFEQIFQQGIPPSDPTIYVAITSKTTRQDAPRGGENWFVMVNAPATGPGWDWTTQIAEYRDRVLALLAERGFDIRQQIQEEKVLTPLDIEQLTGARRGALYGASSNNRWAAFRRPHNRAPDVKGLYFAGGTTHPGGGVPMVTLSGKVASQLLISDGY
jgi:phytoene desaturase